MANNNGAGKLAVLTYTDPIKGRGTVGPPPSKNRQAGPTNLCQGAVLAWCIRKFQIDRGADLSQPTIASEIGIAIGVFRRYLCCRSKISPNYVSLISKYFSVDPSIFSRSPLCCAPHGKENIGKRESVFDRLNFAKELLEDHYGLSVTWDEIAEACDLGYHVVEHIKQRDQRNRTSFDSCKKIAPILNVNPWWLFDGRIEMKANVAGFLKRINSRSANIKVDSDIHNPSKLNNLCQGNRLAYCIKVAQKSQSNLTKRKIAAELGIDQAYLSTYTKCKRSISDKHKKLFSIYFDVDEEWIGQSCKKNCPHKGPGLKKQASEIFNTTPATQADRLKLAKIYLETLNQRKITWSDIAESAGICSSQISRVFKNCQFSLKTCVKLAHPLKVSAAWLRDGSGAMVEHQVAVPKF